MNIIEFKEMLVKVIAAQEKPCVYEISTTEKDCVFSAYVGNACFLVKCHEVEFSSNSLLR